MNNNIDLDENSVKKLIDIYNMVKSSNCCVNYTKTDNYSKIIILFFIITWLFTSFLIGMQDNLFGISIIAVGIIYSLLSILHPLLIQTVNFQFILIGVPLFIFIANIYDGDKTYGVKILLITAIYSGLAIVDYPIKYEYSGLIRMLNTTYTVLMFIYLLYEISVNVKGNLNI